MIDAKKASLMLLKCWDSELKTCASINLKQQKNFTRKSTINNCLNHRKNIKKDRENWAYTDFWRDNKLHSLKKMYTSQKYQVFSGQFQWPKIISLCNSISRIYHMDYSENLSQQYKFEPQSYHFNKSQYSLHCTLNIQLVIPCHMNMFIISQIRLSIILPSLLPLLVIFWKSISHIPFNLSQIFVPDNLKVNTYFKNGSH